MEVGCVLVCVYVKA